MLVVTMASTIVTFMFPVLTLLSVGKCDPAKNCLPENKCPTDLPATLTCLTMVNTPCGAFKDGMMIKAKLGHLTNLQTLIINNCNIIMLRGSPFQDNVNMTDLELISNKFSTYNRNTFQNLRKLESLKITRSTVAVLPDDGLGDLTSLIHLNLQLNRITTLKQRSFSGLGRLQSLDLSYNRITIEANTFDLLTSVQSINLQNNQISSLPDAYFEKTIKLKTLTLNSNNLTTFATSLTLDQLDLSSNELTSIPKVQSKNLKLENNKISTVKGGDFVGMTITLVDLKNNPISQIESGAFTGSVISELNLESTKLTCLPKSMSALTNMTTLLKLDNNGAWECVCGQLWLARYLQTQRGGGPSCRSQNHAGQKLGDIALDLETECVTTTSSSSTTSTSTASTTLATTTPGATTGVQTFPTSFPTSNPNEISSNLPVTKTLQTHPSPQVSTNSSIHQENQTTTGGNQRNPSTHRPGEAGESSPVPIIAGVTCAILLAAAVILGLLLWKKKFKVEPAQESPRFKELPDSLTDRSHPGHAPYSTGCHQGSTDGPQQRKFLSS
ncbi:leucine-rich repeat transmembrane neuronal protein 2-like [Haliotis cracherodii]|uniref:leucine-rich repeat transmembrane neuronal protein 2-like n=1 Tax=Haliotis cracherodii TaxID=6455 RepID=UPI0039E73130